MRTETVKADSLNGDLSVTRDERVRAAVFALGGLLILVASFFVVPADDGVTACLLRVSCGLPCPGCGMTRGFCAISRGDVHAALNYHLLSPFVYAVWTVLVVSRLCIFISGTDHLRRFWARMASYVVVPVLVSFAACWVVGLIRHFQTHSLFGTLKTTFIAKAIAWMT